MGRSTKDVLTAMGYALMLVSVLPLVAQYEKPTWALLPIWLVMVGYVGSILKSLTTDHDRKDRYVMVVRVAWITYYTMAIIWPLPLHWFDSLAVLALCLPSTDPASDGMLMLYYLLSAVSYLDHGDAMQFSGRAILSVLAAVATAKYI